MHQGFKYLRQWYIKENNVGLDNTARATYDACTKGQGNKSCFFLPRLNIDRGIPPQHVTINVSGTANGLPTPTETFTGIVWNFKIENRRYFTTFVEGCTGEVFIPNLDYRVRLTWQRPPPYELPIEYTCGAGLLPG
ncbi:MAG TPA: hypothetical protein VEH06_08380, partial [Candidatus Bathyarchaeia archaeon]|nr:hypothetical protein [Candidatus Bathyarchaeia archaeon]